MFVHNNLLYFVMLDGELFNFNGTNVNKVLLSESLLGRILFTGNTYNETSFSLGTVADGFVQVGNKGNIIKRINSGKGLLDDTVLSMKADNGGNMWLGLDFGIAKIEFESPINSICTQSWLIVYQFSYHAKSYKNKPNNITQWQQCLHKRLQTFTNIRNITQKRKYINIQYDPKSADNQYIYNSLNAFFFWLKIWSIMQVDKWNK